MTDSPCVISGSLGAVEPAAASGVRSRVLNLLDALLTREATRFWWISLAGLVALGLLIRICVFVAFPVFATTDAEQYCKVLHTIESGVVPDLLTRNIGYPLFLLACKAMPLPLHKALPLAQHLLELAAIGLAVVWTRRLWGVLAGLFTAALLLLNSIHCVWSHYAQPNAFLCSVVPIGLIVLMQYILLRRRWYLLFAGVLWLIVFMTREEVLAFAVVPPLVMFCMRRGCRRACRRWAVVIMLIVGVGMTTRYAINYRATGTVRYSRHLVDCLAWHTLHQDELVAIPRPEKLERLYVAALGNGATWRGNHLHRKDLVYAARHNLQLSDRDATAYMLDCVLDCIRQRPGAFIRVGLRDIGRFWLHPASGMEWEVFRQSRPETLVHDVSRLTNPVHWRAEFPASYEASFALTLFHKLAYLRPGENFAIKPLLLLSLVGLLCLLMGVGSRREPLRRTWLLGLAVSIMFMTVFYSTIAEPTDRYRIPIEWAFFAIASLGLVLPLRALRRRLSRPVGTT